MGNKMDFFVKKDISPQTGIMSYRNLILFTLNLYQNDKLAAAGLCSLNKFFGIRNFIFT